MADLSALAGIARDLGPLAAIALFFVWAQHRMAGRLLDAVLVEIRALRESSSAMAKSQADVVSEIRGLRRDLGRAEAAVEQVAGESTAHGRALAELGVTVREHGRRLDALETGPRAPVRPAQASGELPEK